MDAIKSLFKGRMGRGLFFFSLIFVSVIRDVLQTTYENYKKDSEPSYILPVLIVYLLLVITLIIINLSILAKRFHDIGKNGYWSALGLIPYFQWILFIYLIFKNGENKKNKYGKKPQGLIF